LDFGFDYKKNTKKKFEKKKGIFSLIELNNLREKNWKKWLQNFNRYNISSQVWYKLAPQKWRNQVTHQWKRKKFIISEKQKQILVSFNKKIFFLQTRYEFFIKKK